MGFFNKDNWSHVHADDPLYNTCLLHTIIVLKSYQVSKSETVLSSIKYRSR